MVVAILLFIVGLVLLIKGGDWFVDSATCIAHRFKLPELLIGATIVSIGTTLPEVMVSSTSALAGHSEIAYGNALGSIICNTALISAITMAIKPGKVDRKSFLIPIIFFFTSALFYVLIAYITGYFYRIVGIILLLIFISYIVLQTLLQKKQNVKAEEEITLEEKEEDKPTSLVKDIVLLVVGAILIAVGAHLLVTYGSEIASFLGVPESVIALTFIALGTSLPELVTAITALVKGHSNLSLGNIIGANLFNLVFVSGMASTLRPFAVPESNKLFGINASYIVDIPVMFLVMLILAVPSLIKGKVSRAQGIVLLVIYAAYCILQFVM